MKTKPEGEIRNRSTGGAHQFMYRNKAKLIAILFAVYDIVATNLAYAIGLLLRFDVKVSEIPLEQGIAWLKFVPILAAVTLAAGLLFRLYNSVWRFVSYVEVIDALMASIAISLAHFIFCRILGMHFPHSSEIIGALLVFIFLAGIRVSYRAVRLVFNKFMTSDTATERVLVVGGGEAGRIVIREINGHIPQRSKVICITDDAIAKRNKSIDGVPIVGPIHLVPQLVKDCNIDRVIIAIPSAGNARKKEIIEDCKAASCPISILPSISDSLDTRDILSNLREVRIEELLGRDPIKIDNDQIDNLIEGKTVMVTGGGGSIGSELVRQISQHKPARLVIFDIYENNAYDLQQELIRTWAAEDREAEEAEAAGDTGTTDSSETGTTDSGETGTTWPYHPELVVLIGSVRDENRLMQIMKQYRPSVVFHAAAHKHVPLMEGSPNESIKNNVIGTRNCARAASACGVERFVLISTDKAVNPTNIMGASKRLCEMVVQSMNEISDTEFVAVRFGNVLGSNGSVVPLFKKQIAEGGPVTVTHKDITRFFMTIPEAVSLVLQAGTFGAGGEIFVLDMGSPVKIDDLARNLIYLAGLIPDDDIQIEYTGLRPGEKLYEEILMDEEGLRKTENDLIFIGQPIDTGSSFWDKLAELEAAGNENRDDIKDIVADMVKTYHPA